MEGFPGTGRPRIAVVGCGALGSYYGACLARSGLDVRFLLRSDYEAVRRDGVRIESAHGGSFTVRPGVAREAGEIGPCDLVVIGLKTTANGELGRLVSPLVGPGTALLTLQNGLGNEEALARLFGAERVLGGLCFVCLNRTAPGVVRHLAHGRIVMGEMGRAATERAATVAGWFRAGGVPCEVTDHLEAAHWEKLVWNIPFNGLGVAGAAGYESVLAGRRMGTGPLGACLATDVLLAEARWLALVRELMEETLRAARAQGLGVPESAAGEQIERTRQMGAYRASTLIDFERGLPLERESLFGEPLRRARAHGVEAPRLAALHALLGELEQERTRAGKAVDQ
ncbi:MAG: 2-dehydropantoate 2-reductase [Verrucomicrobiae bacterium]|nr:2-dehydropantoate 2-reductase [Verrucomicrobiae bacterium]